MQTYNDTLIEQFDDPVTGNAAALALVHVFDTGTTNVTSIFDLAGSPISNPLTTDTKGNYQFKANDGTYDIVGKFNTPDETRRDKVQFVDLQVTTIPIVTATVASMKDDTNASPGNTYTTQNNNATALGGGADYLIKTAAQATTDGDVIDGSANHTNANSTVSILQDAENSDVRAFGVIFDDSSAGVKTSNAAALIIAMGFGAGSKGSGALHTDLFAITGKVLKSEFNQDLIFTLDQDGADSITFNTCSGHVTNMRVSDTKEIAAGVRATIFMEDCVKFDLIKPRIDGGKDLPIALYQCDDCNVIKGIGIGTDANRPFAWEMVDCSNSVFEACVLFKYNFGFTHLGPGLQSTRDRFPNVRTASQCRGMRTHLCYVKDYFGHAFDMNGTTASGFENSIAEQYTGVVGNSSFQIKQTTTGPELATDTHDNWIDTCTAVDCVTGFGTQEGTDCTLTNIKAIDCKRYPVLINATPRAVVNGLLAKDWGTDLTTFPILGGGDTAGAVTMLVGSNDCVVDNVTCVLTTETTHITSLGLVVVDGDNTSVGRFRLRKLAAVTSLLKRAITIDGANTDIAETFRPVSAFYTEHAIKDNVDTTMYPLTFDINLDVSVVGTVILNDVPQRGLLPGKVIAISSSIVGSPQYMVGIRSNSQSLIALRATPATIEFLDPLATVATNEPLVARINTVGTSGNLSISVRGCHLL